MPTDHPIVALWAHPRSMSTATERIMRERGDCTVFHEPFLADYYVHRAVREMPMLEIDDDAPRDYDSVRDMLLGAAAEGPVFFKDMSYYVVPRIFADEDFARRLFNVFLIRDPRRAIASYFKLDPDLTLTEIGLEAQWQHFSYLRDELGQDPVVIEAEAVQADPRGVMAEVWRRAGLPFTEGAFDWSRGDVPDNWKHVEGWHGDVMSSSGITRSADDPDDVFRAVAAEAAHLNDYLAHHAPFHERLREYSIAPGQA